MPMLSRMLSKRARISSGPANRPDHNSVAASTINATAQAKNNPITTQWPAMKIFCSCFIAVGPHAVDAAALQRLRNAGAKAFRLGPGLRQTGLIDLQMDPGRPQQRRFETGRARAIP